MEATENPIEENLSDHILPLKLKEYIENIAKSEGFVTYEILSKKLPANGGGYMGILYEVDIKGKTIEGEKELNIFVKNILENEQMKIYSVPEVFNREAFVYTDLAKVFAELQENANIPYKERLQLAKSYDQCNPKSIILENLSKRGFKVYDRMDVISLEYAVKCIEELGKLHALSIALQKEKPEYFNENIVTMKQPFKFNEDWQGFATNMYNYAINCLEPDIREEVGQMLLEKVNNYPMYMNDTSGFCTFCHGDYKHNNIMAKEGAVYKWEIEEAIPIDFQISHYGSPMLDFLYFVFNGSDRGYRRNHLPYFKSLYYGSIERFLKYFGMDFKKILPRMEFEKIYKEKLEFGLMINVLYVPFLFAAEGDVPDVANESLSSLSFKVDSRYTERIRGVVNEFIRWGYFGKKLRNKAMFKNL